ncbi:hypothetical protein Taro_052587 [Colocasia esculenta]|uniref:Thioredoxin domain-containing protein n=1 Tax=Colocasia esculenta TaxID=4460 RepID=A0A843XK49_COLES|nr:hypothetical protein [Colocasia esculenta]
MMTESSKVTAMEAQEQLVKSRVLKVESEAAWDSHIAQASNQGCPVIVHFTASWCVPSIAMNPFFESLAQSYEDAVFLLVDVDDVKPVAAKMEVKAMPTFVLLREGRVLLDKIVGANPEEIRKRVDGFLHSCHPQADVESV